MGELLMTLPLFIQANPSPYVAIQPQGKGLIVNPDGVGQTEILITGIASDFNSSICGTPDFVGRLDEHPGKIILGDLTVKELETQFVRGGEILTELVEIVEGFKPLRTLMISGVVGREVSGGKTIYGVDINTNCLDAMYVGVASKQNQKEDFIFKKWVKANYPNYFARPVVSGREFRILIFTVGAGRFEINSITAWMKLTDRRGFNTSPQAVKGAPE